MIDRTIIERFTKVIWNTSNRGLAAIAYLARVDQSDELLIYGTTEFDFYFTESRLITFLKDSFELATHDTVEVAPFIARRLQQFTIEWPTDRLLVTIHAMQTLETTARWGLAGDLSQAKPRPVATRLKLLGELQQAEILWENQDELSRLQQILTPMPPVLKQHLLQFWQQEYQRNVRLLLSPFTRTTVTSAVQLGEKLVNSLVSLLLVAQEQYGTGATITTAELAALTPDAQLATQVTAFYQALVTVQPAALTAVIDPLTQQIEQL